MSWHASSTGDWIVTYERDPINGAVLTIDHEMLNEPVTVRGHQQIKSLYADIRNVLRAEGLVL